MVIPVHPAPGLGDLLPGWFAVPQNPIRDAGTPIKATITAKAGGAVVKVPSIGDLLPAMFTVPQNPLRKALASPPGSGVPGTGTTGMGLLGCGSCGMGQTSAPTTGGMMGSLASTGTGIMAWLQQPSFISSSIPNWALVGGGVAALFLFMPGGEQYRQVRARSRGYRRLAARMAA